MKLGPAVNRFVRLARGPSSATLAATIASQLFLAGSGLVAARALGVDGRGTLAFLWLVPAVLILLGGIGIPPATTYFVAKERENARHVVLKSIRLLTIPAVLLVSLYALVLTLFELGGHEYSTIQAAFSVSLIPVLLAQNLGIASLLGQERFRFYNIARIFPPFLYTILAAILWATGVADLTALLAVMAGSWFVSAILTWALLCRDLPVSSGDSVATSRDIAGFGLRGVIGSVSPIDDVRLDQFVVGLALDARALGLYVTAVAFCNLPRFVAFSIGAVAYPKIAAATGRKAWRIAIRYLRIGVPLVIGSVAAMMVALPFVLPLFFGESFSGAVSIGRILLVAAVFLGTNRLLSEIARGLGHPGYSSISEAVNGLVFICTVLAVSGSLSAHDVAWAVVAGAVVSCLVLARLVARSRLSLPEEHADPGSVAADSLAMRASVPEE